MRSDLPIARYVSRSISLLVSVGGSAHTPLAWCLVSRGLALSSLRSTRSKPAAPYAKLKTMVPE